MVPTQQGGNASLWPIPEQGSPSLFVKGPENKNVRLVGLSASVVVTQLCCRGAEAARSTYANECGCLPV